MVQLPQEQPQWQHHGQGPIKQEQPPPVQPAQWTVHQVNQEELLLQPLQPQAKQPLQLQQPLQHPHTPQRPAQLEQHPQARPEQVTQLQQPLQQPSTPQHIAQPVVHQPLVEREQPSRSRRQAPDQQPMRPGPSSRSGGGGGGASGSHASASRGSAAASLPLQALVEMLGRPEEPIGLQQAQAARQLADMPLLGERLTELLRCGSTAAAQVAASEFLCNLMPIRTNRAHANLGRQALAPWMASIRLALVQLLGSGKASVAAAAAGALRCLADRSPEEQRAIATANGCAQRLAAVLCRGVPVAQRMAASLVAMLADHPDSLRPLRQADGLLQGLVQLLHSRHGGVVVAAAAALTNLAADDAAQLVIGQTPGCLNQLVALLSCGDADACSSSGNRPRYWAQGQPEQVQQHAACALCVLVCGCPANQQALAAVPGVWEHLHAALGQRAIKLHVLDALLNLADGNPATASRIVDACLSVGELVTLLEYREQVQVHASATGMLVSLAAAEPAVLEEVMHLALPKIAQLLSRTSRGTPAWRVQQEASAALVVLSAYGDEAAAAVAHELGDLRQVVALLGSSVTSRAAAPEAAVSVLAIQQNAAALLGNLGDGSAARQAAVRSAGALPALAALLSSPEAGVRAAAARALASLVQKNRVSQQALKQGSRRVSVSEQLEKLEVSDPDAEVREHARGALDALRD